MTTAADIEDREGRVARFVISGTAAPKERARARLVQPKGGKPFITMYTPAETAKYEARVKRLAQGAWGNNPVSLRPIDLQVTVYVEIPTSWPNWKQDAAARGVVVPTGVPDLDNFVKAISDAMNGVVYRDDGQIVQLDAVKIYAQPSEPGRVEVAVRENYRCGSWIKRADELSLLR